MATANKYIGPSADLGALNASLASLDIFFCIFITDCERRTVCAKMVKIRVRS